ncbi:hypothetical protein HDU78_006902 [Chytriomyces hyalinus]|nr:hypothetical protein HDU78_006902 [Chytriomyces hyalinus]KAJ3265346.1 hypothetical protein HDU77_005589 [Chytriomyces hyalinus]
MSKGASSIEIRLEQDIFAEVAKLIAPIAEAYVLDMKIEDQHIKKALPLLGETEVASATAIKIEKFAIKGVVMPINEGFVNVNIDDAEFKVSMDVTALGGHLGITTVSAILDVDAKVRFVLEQNKMKTDVYECAVALRDFDTQIGTGITGDILSYVTEMIESVLKSSIEASLQSTVTSSLEQALDSILSRQWDIAGNVSKVFYNLAVHFLETPTVTKANGLMIVIGIDANYKMDAEAGVAALKIEH